MPLVFEQPGRRNQSCRKEYGTIELFIEFVDQIYWPGYAEQLAQDDPEKFTWAYNEFVEFCYKVKGD